MEILKKIYFFILDTLQTILLAASIFLVIYIFLFRPFQVSGVSMYPTFKDKEYILTNLISLKLGGNPVRGDVIVFKAPIDHEKDFIKRVIGLPGDSITVKGGYVFVNGKKLDESVYLHNNVTTYGGATIKEDSPFTIPADEFIVMGDNRPNSSDSREWGVVKKSELIGKSFFVYWPLTNMRVVKNPFPPSIQK